MKLQLCKLMALSSVFLMYLVSPSTNAALYNFAQGGFDNGGLITGSFAGIDRIGTYDENGMSIPDGKISICFGRGCSDPGYDDLQSFSIHFSGNSFFSSLNQLPDLVLNHLEYDFSANFLKLSFGTESTTGDVSRGSFSYNAGYGVYREAGVLLGVSLSAEPIPNDGSFTTDSLDVGSFIIHNSSGEFIASHFSLSTTEPLIVSQVPIPNALILFVTAIATLLGRLQFKSKS